MWRWCCESDGEWEGQDQSILRLIIGDVEDPYVGLSKLFWGSSQQSVDFNAGFGVVDQGLLTLVSLSLLRI